MSDASLLDASGLTRGTFTYFPVAPGRVEFAQAVRAQILAEGDRLL